MGFSRKRKSDAVADEGGGHGGFKRAKAPSTAFQPSKTPQTDAEGNQYWEISKSRRVTLTEFKGMKMVNVREYYQKDGEWKPGAKGISMTLEQYSAFVTLLPQIEQSLKAQGERVPRPDYSDAPPGEEDTNVEENENEDDDDDDDDDDDEEEESKKPNFEATSDEDE